MKIAHLSLILNLGARHLWMPTVIWCQMIGVTARPSAQLTVTVLAKPCVEAQSLELFADFLFGTKTKNTINAQKSIMT